MLMYYKLYYIAGRAVKLESYKFITSSLYATT